MTTILNILGYVSILMLVALGLAIVFGMMDIVNLAHAEWVTIGAYALAVAQAVGGKGAFWLALLVAPAVGALLGWCLERFIIRLLYHRPLDTLLATYAVSLIVQKALDLIFGTQPMLVYAPFEGAVRVPGGSYPIYRLFVIGVALSVTASCWLLSARTRFGTQLRAVIQHPAMAEAAGIDTRRLNRIAFCGGAALASLAGVLVAPMVSVESHLGVAYLAKAFFVIVLGGIGSIAGSIVGSAVIGTAETLLGYRVDPSLASAIVLILSIVVIRFRPQGLIPGFSAAHQLLGKG
ncbi:branched-chain amino acid ABC transporter permease [Burkholderia multivorans]|uniref:branched-chain amino acid ABC transporter permease n=1 Tax=Burkholderia multivorans TaxID=87883 RepID=UPI001C25EC6A|nr:branched-chain amino acid ABC transporter permease [Burkholderia multivorans]MBU9597950.1 branched-chain amino acid ABC transporter permease [Burkholderia multivorans]MDN8000213.1 branched-chain amino acid ABC transporter permease [Burkholderia multivorans]